MDWNQNMEKKIKLEEILQDCWITTLDNSKEVHASTEDVKLAMIEFGKQLLKLATENAETKIDYVSTGEYSGYERIIVDKQSILDTIKQIE